MSDELARVMAFAYHRRGVAVMERSKLFHLLTFDLRWFSPDPAKRILARAIASGLLVQEGESLRIAFDPKTVDVPLNYRPREDLADATGPIDVPEPPPPADPDAAEVERARLGKLVTLDVARLIVARRAGEDVRERAADLEGRLAAEGPTR